MKASGQAAGDAKVSGLVTSDPRASGLATSDSTASGLAASDPGGDAGLVKFAGHDGECVLYPPELSLHQGGTPALETRQPRLHSRELQEQRGSELFS